MNFWKEIAANKVLIAALLGWFIAQALKVVYILITEKKFNIKKFVESGGMPSSHSAFVSAMAVAVGFTEGFASSFFGISFVLAFIVMYDASGVRKAAGDQAKVINSIQEMFSFEAPVYLKEILGHTWLEVIVGSVLGIIISLIMFL